MNILLINKQHIDSQNTAIIDDPKQVEHIKTILKAAVGDRLKIGVLGGKMGVGYIASMGDSIQLQACLLDKKPPAKLPLTVVLALPRPKILRRLIMDMTAMGVSRIVIINSVRCQKSYWQSPQLTQTDHFILDGLQQSCDTIKPDIILAKRFRPFVEDELSQWAGAKWVLHPYDVGSNTCHATDYKHALPSVVFIGAEGGFVPFEIELLIQHGVVPIRLGDRILRTEAVVNAFLGWYAFFG